MKMIDLQRDSSQCYAQPVLSFSKSSLQESNSVLAKDSRHVSDEAEGPWVGFKSLVKSLGLHDALFAVLDKYQARTEEIPRNRARSDSKQMLELKLDLEYIMIELLLLPLEFVAILF